MGKEIELKFLVPLECLSDILFREEESYSIIQGYVRGAKGVRVRCVNRDKSLSAYITLKSKRNGITRLEYEYEIPFKEGQEILRELCDSLIIKTRHIISVNKKEKWEIDLFHGDNSGLIIAELEVPREDYDVKMDEWMSGWKPIVNDDRYYNGSLAKNPYKNWSKENV